MFRKTPEHVSSGLSKKKQKPAASLLISMSTFMAICAKRADLVSRKIKAKATRTIRGTQKKDPSSLTFASRQKQLLLKISNKAVGFMHRKRIGNHAGPETEPEEWSDCGVWQKTILMGDKCEPLDFSGVIYYDSNGNQVSEAPSSPTFASRLKQLLLKISNKAVGFMHRKRIENHADAETEPEEWSDCAVWQKTILMGDKCEPLYFSGVINYDSNGNQVSEAPLRSPRAGPLPGYISPAGKADHL